MKKYSVPGIILTLGALVAIKVFQEDIPRISEPITNALILIVAAIAFAIYIILRVKNKD